MTNVSVIFDLVSMHVKHLKLPVLLLSSTPRCTGPKTVGKHPGIQQETSPSQDLGEFMLPLHYSCTPWGRISEGTSFSSSQYQMLCPP